MNAYLQSLLRHAFTALAGLGGFLAAHSLIGAGDVASVDSAGASIGSALTVILMAVGTRLLITLLGKLNLGGSASATDKLTGWSVWICIGTAAGFGGIFLPSCSQNPGASNIPVHGVLYTDYGSLGYDSKSGIDVEIDAQTLAKIAKPTPPAPPAAPEVLPAK